MTDVSGERSSYLPSGNLSRLPGSQGTDFHYEVSGYCIVRAMGRHQPVGTDQDTQAYHKYQGSLVRLDLLNSYLDASSKKFSSNQAKLTLRLI